MEMIKCVECEMLYDRSLSCCPGCGCPTNLQKPPVTQPIKPPPIYNPVSKPIPMPVQNNMKKKNTGLKTLQSWLIIIALACFILSGVFFSKGFNVKNDYYNSENYPSLNRNAYVGGDAYNYIINGTYFTGYSVLGSAALICGMILIHSSINVTIKLHDEKE